ncbi:diguanylate cyclase (GGDEF)-like protein [Actinoalloteichus hoggarensis]|uniref:GGDEF domain-containing protein n=1 Tax=Actinoalloteichus hoggarensis TaxID=1470176 RepID=UPI00161F2B62|nr:GGDEF domain-containing protein [Actinoalloteichus hoggarensis]MBB5921719.1 diguanylate cyclase (GGDEF)-like protein [Actinoalloteichus hoggarensis]
MAARGCRALHRESVGQRESSPEPSERSDAWLIARAHELIVASQVNDQQLQFSTADEINELLDEGRRRGEPSLVAQLLRASAVIRLVTRGHAELADPLLDELISHSRRHGLTVMEADGRALLARRMMLVNNHEVTLDETAKALAMLNGKLSPDPLTGRRAWERQVALALQDIALVLTQLGVYEMADEEMTRAEEFIRSSGGPHQIAVHLINRTRMLVGWGLRLERADRMDEAADRFALASALATSVEGPWPDSLHPRSHRDQSAADQVPVVGSAHALAKPGGEHVPRLDRLLQRSRYPRELLITSLALSRCLEHDGDHDDALEVLRHARREMVGDPSEPPLQLSLIREFARLCGPDDGQAATALSQYNAALESELWMLREVRMATLISRRDHERLRRQHGDITRQALQDPLTGLANRRALDERMDLLVVDPDAHPLSVALCDLDGFKGVNDRCSHAEGDDVLRVVASTLRDTLRANDVVARYGGDEFVVLMPTTTLGDAEAALTRAVDAVRELPQDLSRGVTLSIGVVAVTHQEGSGHALTRADAAMYQAKRGGGSRVFARRSTVPLGADEVVEPDTPA